MKKLFAFLTLLMLMLVMTACATHASRENVDIARQALEIVDEFLFRPRPDPDATYRRIAALPSINIASTGNTRQDEANRALRSYISSLQSAIQTTRHIYSAETRQPVLIARNQIASEIGVRTRR